MIGITVVAIICLFVWVAVIFGCIDVCRNPGSYRITYPIRFSREELLFWHNQELHDGGGDNCICEQQEYKQFIEQVDFLVDKLELEKTK